MYLLKHIYTRANSAINHLIVALVLTTSACMFSFTALRAAITTNNGHGNTNLSNTDIDKCNAAIGFMQPLSLQICNAWGAAVPNLR
jgi:hypothetical protein